MDALNFLLSNGRSTEIPELDNSIEVLVRTAACASPSSTENSQNNAWNVNFSDGNTNNNNKYNSNAVRAVAALGEEIKEGWVAAFHDCCRNKKSSHNCNEYRAADWELDLWLLVYEIYFLHNYTPKTSVCFIVTRPTLREIFAANFRDRIVQHWICMRLEPLFDKRFKSQGDVSHNCRKGYGTRSAVDALERDIKEVSQNYTREAWVAKIDIQSFFMSIDTRILWQNLERFIKEEYKGDDIDILLYLTEVTVKHRPQNDCIRQSPGELWEMLAPHKSLFNHPEGIGIAIGNITSQQEANFYMSFYVEEIKPMVEEAGAKIEQFVDDVPNVATTKEFCLKFRKESERILREKLNLKMHPNKFYLQPVKKGVKFVGQVIMPGRRYISNRTLGNFVNQLRRTERLCQRILDGDITDKSLAQLRHDVCSINSYLGFMVHTASYRMRAKIFKRECRAFWKICYTRQFAVCKVKVKYDIKQFLINQEIQNYGMDLHRDRAKTGRNQGAPRHEAAHRKLQHRATRQQLPDRPQVQTPSRNP